MYIKGDTKSKYTCSYYLDIDEQTWGKLPPNTLDTFDVEAMVLWLYDRDKVRLDVFPDAITHCRRNRKVINEIRL
jgi:hypothetical protein